MSTCPACENARQHPNSDIYQMKCDGCSARALARSPEFHAAAKTGAMTQAYRMALAQFFPAREREGHELVKGWITQPTISARRV
jgi:hypothetical protein